jgi:hypothetical protein
MVCFLNQLQIALQKNSLVIGNQCTSLCSFEFEKLHSVVQLTKTGK